MDATVGSIIYENPDNEEAKYIYASTSQFLKPKTFLEKNKERIQINQYSFGGNYNIIYLLWMI